MTPPRSVIIIPTAVANLASVRAAFNRLGVHCECSDDATTIRNAEYAVLPGVGAFGAGMRTLHDCGIVEALQQRISTDSPTLAICLGMQLLGIASEETPAVSGLGVIDSVTTRFSAASQIPQMGWNWVEAPSEMRYAASGYAYFANSYCIRTPPQGWTAALSNYEEPFVAALERGRILACQFHPELSSRWGLSVLKAWLDGEQKENASC